MPSLSKEPWSENTPSKANHFTKRDLAQSAMLLGVIVTIGAGLFLSTSLSTPTLISLIGTMILSPLALHLEKRGLTRTQAVLILFVICGILIGLGGFFLSQTIANQWTSFQALAPEYFKKAVAELKGFEQRIQSVNPLLEQAQITERVLAWGNSTGSWFLTHGPKLVGDLLTWALIVPIMTFFLLKDGRSFKRSFFQLVPNRYFESTFIVSTKITDSLSDYLRAKLLEASLVGFLCMCGLWIVQAPYATILGVIAGVTNILPYVGPFLGAAPAIIICALDPANSHLVWQVAAVFMIVNLVDTVYVFPVLVAKLVNLHPLVLVFAVILGQQYYGLIGMLISIPLASTIKIIGQELYVAIYDPARSKSGAASASSVSTGKADNS